MSFDFDLTAPFQTAFTTRDQHEHRHKVRPVQIIAPSKCSKFCARPFSMC
ncbi:Protein CBG26234 [Caenorhabditis briggsae]|uniref:Protein CBG26234 n=1 Tax=Caenorhabditis briggsae TaxID=6238 RepID=B6IIY9_CAEBR|nr:Protein CBG26234 [Caenorhabditis briggsae]CAR99869.1 Protein CBG26234 [Caenorhabditis briggsae]